MTRFATNTLAALVAVLITATSLHTITTVPGQPPLALVSAPVLA